MQSGTGTTFSRKPPTFRLPPHLALHHSSHLRGHPHFFYFGRDASRCAAPSRHGSRRRSYLPPLPTRPNVDLDKCLSLLLSRGVGRFRFQLANLLHTSLPALANHRVGSIESTHVPLYPSHISVSTYKFGYDLLNKVEPPGPCQVSEIEATEPILVGLSDRLLTRIIMGTVSELHPVQSLIHAVPAAPLHHCTTPPPLKDCIIVCHAAPDVEDLNFAVAA